MPKPLLLRLAPALLVGYALYSAAFLVLVVDAGSFSIGGVQIPWGVSAASVLSVHVFGIVVSIALAVGFLQERRWARPVMVWNGPILFILLVFLVPGSARREAFSVVPRVVLIAFAAFSYLYWKPKEYFERAGEGERRPYGG